MRGLVDLLCGGSGVSADSTCIERRGGGGGGGWPLDVGPVKST